MSGRDVTWCQRGDCSTHLISDAHIVCLLLRPVRPSIARPSDVLALPSRALSACSRCTDTSTDVTDTAKSLLITDRDFITRMIYKDMHLLTSIYLYVCLILSSVSMFRSRLSLFLTRYTVMYSFTLSRCGLSICIKALID